MKKIFFPLLLSILLLTGPSAKAQMSYGGEPRSFSDKTLSLNIPTIEIEKLNVKALLEEDAQKVGKDHPLRIGVTKPVSYSMENAGREDYLPDGGKVWRLAFHMDGATFTSMHFSEFEIPDGAELYFYTPEREEFIGKFTNKNRMEDGTFYPQEMPGDEIIVEYYEPASAAFHGKLTIDRISQGYYDFFHIEDAQLRGGLGDADGTCHPNAICYDDTWHDQINSVVCYTMSTGEYIYMCSGAMINNTSHDKSKYMLSANHCNESGTWTFYFQYQATTCEGSNGSIYKTATGYTVLAKDAGTTSSDFMLVKITGFINPSFHPYLAGWDISNTPTNATSCGAIHHPGGDIKKFSVPQNIINGSSSGYPRYWAATWAYETGTTEQGSSGSPLFNKDKLIVGQLYAGTSSCVATGQQGESGPSGWDLYGKLSYSWTNNNNSSDAKKLKPWLDPNNTGASTLAGEYLYTYEGLEENEADHLQVYPNPTSGRVTLSGTFEGREGACRIYDMAGHLVMNKNIALNNAIELDCTHFTCGFYIVEITDNQNIYRTKISVTR